MFKKWEIFRALNFELEEFVNKPKCEYMRASSSMYINTELYADELGLLGISN